MMRRQLSLLAGLSLCLLFVGLGLLFLPRVGVQYDEALFSTVIFDSVRAEFSFYGVPLMLMSYIGALKAALYAPLLHWANAGYYTLRLPVLMLGTVSVWLVYLTLRRLAGTVAALCATLLLATDAIYLLTCLYDWGPVALQHVLFAGALYGFVRFGDDARPRWIFTAGLCAGLALWDKALAIWLLAGFGVAAMIVMPRVLWGFVRTQRRATAALVLGFLLGAAPFLIYNFSTGWRTFTANTQIDDQELKNKLIALDRTFDGSGLFGYLVRESPENPSFRPVIRLWEKPTLFLNGKLGNPRQSLQHLLLVCALLAAPLACWRGPNRRVALILACGAVLSYLLMFATRKAGGSVHHTVLLWPVPHVLAGLLAGALVPRCSRGALSAVAGVFVICAASNLAVLNSYFAHLIVAGPTMVWTDAIRPLVDQLGREPGRLIFCADWGITQQILYFGKGRIGYDHASDGVVVGLPNAAEVEYLRRSLADPALLFVTHTEGREAFVGVRARLLEFAAAEGYQDRLVKTISDRFGVPLFEVHEFRR